MKFFCQKSLAPKPAVVATTPKKVPEEDAKKSKMAAMTPVPSKTTPAKPPVAPPKKTLTKVGHFMFIFCCVGLVS